MGELPVPSVKTKRFYLHVTFTYEPLVFLNTLETHFQCFKIIRAQTILSSKIKLLSFDNQAKVSAAKLPLQVNFRQEIYIYIYIFISSTTTIVLFHANAICGRMIGFVVHTRQKSLCKIPEDSPACLLLDLPGSFFPALLHLIHKGVPDLPEAIAHLAEIPRRLASLSPDLSHRRGPYDPLGDLPAGYLSLDYGVGCDLGRPADRPRLRQLLHHMEVVDEVRQQTVQHVDIICFCPTFFPPR